VTKSSDPIKDGMRLNRRAFLRNSLGLLGGAALSELGLHPAWMLQHAYLD